MAPDRVLRFSRSDDESAFVLLQVTSKGSRPLDLKLVGTEGEAPYVASLKHDRVSSLRVKNCPASESEWQAILESLFNQKPLLDIQAMATVQSESSISITVRKETQGITQRLGAITLSHDADEAIELFEWCGVAVEASVDAKQAVANLTVKVHESDAAVAQLKSQLEELLRAKEEDETALLRKFRDLLNEKKVKIREQHQVLASGSFNASHPGSAQSQPSQSQSAASPPPKPTIPSRKVGQSRGTKRKQPASKRVEESDYENSPEAMDVDIKQEPENTDPGETTEATTSTASDDEDDGVDKDPPAKPTDTKKPLNKKMGEQPPPRRNLPFNNKSSKPSPAPAVTAGSETDSGDEL